MYSQNMRKTLLFSLVLAMEVIPLNAFIINPPKNMTIQWQDNEITIYCNNPDTYFKSICYKMKLRFKSSNKKHWQKPLTSAECDEYTSFSCKFHTVNFYREECYTIEFKFLGLENCFLKDYESDWSPNISLTNGVVSDSCMENEDVVEDTISNKFLILLCVSSAFLLLVIFITTFACAIKRLKKFVFPIIPDPEHMFYGLFEDYRGNFQEWTNISGNETKQDHLDCSDNGAIIEEYIEEQKHLQTKESILEDEYKEENYTQEKEYRALSEIPHLALEQMKNIVITSSVLENSSDICTENTHYAMNDSTYIML